MSISTTFAPNTIIASSPMNTILQTDIRDKYNAAINSSTGHLHDGNTGNGPPVAKVNASNVADSVIISGVAPTASKSIAMLNGELQFYDGTAARKALGSYRLPKGFYNFSLVRSAANTIKITSRGGTALSTSNPLIVVIDDPINPGQLSEFVVTSDVSINFDSAVWGFDTYGNLTGVVLRVFAINDNGTLRWGVGLLNRGVVTTTDTTATAASVNLPEMILCNSAVSSSTNYCMEAGYFFADFTDASNTWSIETGAGKVVSGKSGDGIMWPFASTVTGTTTNSTVAAGQGCQIGRRFLFTWDSSTRTSNATGFSMNLPVKARIQTNLVLGPVIDNSTTPTSPGSAQTQTGGVLLNLFKDQVQGTWTNVNNKRVFQFEASFEIGPAASFVG